MVWPGCAEDLLSYIRHSHLHEPLGLLQASMPAEQPPWPAAHLEPNPQLVIPNASSSNA